MNIEQFKKIAASLFYNIKRQKDGAQIEAQPFLYWKILVLVFIIDKQSAFTCNDLTNSLIH